MYKSIDITNKKYGKLKAVRYDHTRARRQQYWLFECECGNEEIRRKSHVTSGSSKCCKNCNKKHAGDRVRTHNMTNTKEFSSWQSMLTRVLNKNSDKFFHYGGRGIKVCKRWLRFENFYKDMGKRPNNKTLDRIDVNGNYKKSNCRWATPKEQENNRRNTRFITFRGVTDKLDYWERRTGIKRQRIYQRIFVRNWNIEKALTLH